MEKLVKKIEQKSEVCINVELSGLGFEIYCQKEIEKGLKADLYQYIHPKQTVNTSEKKIKLYYVVSDGLFEEVMNNKSNKEGTRIQIFRSNMLNKHANRYDYGEYKLFYCDIEPYFLFTFEDKIYVLLRKDSKNIYRLYFRVMVEVTLRAKRYMGYHLIHAACVCINDKALLICGNKAAGKTTLMSHLLNSGKTNFISNDKVFLSADLSEIEYFPLVARIGGGTLNKFSKYDLRNEYYRISKEDKKKGKEDLGNDKWDFTPVEMAKIFNCEYKEAGKLEAVIIPNIGENNEEKITMVNEDVLNFDLYTDGCVTIENWLLNDTLIDYFNSKKQDIDNVEKATYEVYQVDYNYKSQSNRIMDKISEKLWKN